ncbi:MBOAT family protein [Cooperia oncophora]
MSFMVEEASIWNWPNLAMVLLSNITILVVFMMEKILEKGYLSNYSATVFYSILIPAHLAIPAAFTLVLKGNPVCSICALSVFVVESLKLVSYVHVNYWCRCARLEKAATKKDDVTRPEISHPEMASLYPASLNLCNLYYFMLAPTLCYELKFPRSVRRRKSFLIKRFIELVFLTFLLAALVQQWIVPTVHNSMRPLNEMELGRCLERLLKLAIPNIVIWLIGFYTLFHSFLNFIAEVLKFADREFYRDFWNSETTEYFWRTWNIPVHRWAARHIYFPMIRNNYNKFSATTVSVPLHMFRLWAYYGMMAQIPLTFITSYVIKGGRAGNVIVWLSLILGQPLATLMYVHDWYVLHQTSTEVVTGGDQLSS